MFLSAIEEISISILEVISDFHLGTEAGEGQDIMTGMFIHKEFLSILLQENPGVCRRRRRRHHHMGIMTRGPPRK